jgi:hypothetical protein
VESDLPAAASTWCASGVRLLLPHRFVGSRQHLNPQLDLQVGKTRSNQRLPAGLHPNRTLTPWAAIPIELLRFLAMLQSPFLQLPRVSIDKRNLLEARW